MELEDQQYLLIDSSSPNERQRSDKHGPRTLFQMRFIGVVALISLMGWMGLTQPSPAPLHHDVSLSPMNPSSSSSGLDRDNLKDQCGEFYFSQRLDHFSTHKEAAGKERSYMQRYFVCDTHWTKNQPIFFYVGNEADVELYLNHSGLMWENAPTFGAMLVFAEHRYFGQSIPAVAPSSGKLNMAYLSSEQALADYANLIRYLKEDQYDSPQSPVIAFGGSYGGMLASWFRMKYPHVIDGAIAGSAPILSFPGEHPAVDPTGYSKVITFDASPEAGSASNCIPNIKSAWTSIQKLGQSASGRQTLKETFGLCSDLQSNANVSGLMEWIKDAFSSMAMGNYPYPSSYLLNGIGMLPAYPVRAACAHLQDLHDEDDNMVLLSNLRESISIFYNATKDKACYDLFSPNNASQQDGDFWGYLYCTEMCQPFSSTGVSDMFWPEVQNWTQVSQDCQAQWQVRPRLEWATTIYGGRKALRTASNIVFSNGNYDPWSAYGVLDAEGNSDLTVVMIDGGAHHLDLMFSHPLDPPSVKAARKAELADISKWIAQSRAFTKTSEEGL